MAEPRKEKACATMGRIVKMGGTVLGSAGIVVAAPMLLVVVGVAIVGIEPEESRKFANRLVQSKMMMVTMQGVEIRFVGGPS